MGMKSYGKDLRAKIVKRREQGASAAEVARNFQVHKRTVERYWKRYQERGEAYCKQRGGYRRSTLDPHRERVIGWLGKLPDITLDELQRKLSKDCRLSLDTSTLCRQLQKMGFSFKKNATGQRARAR
jgi:transposase